MAMQARWKGYKRALSDAGITTTNQQVERGDFTSGSGYRAAESLMLHQGRPNYTTPTAIFAFNDRMAIGAIHWLRENHYDVPNDVSVAGFDDIISSEDIYPTLTTIHQHSYALGQKAADILIDMIDGKRLRTLETVLPTHLVVRASTGVCKGSVINTG
jgi:DNA-binding LacI/PurR family transcriptional regulator